MKIQILIWKIISFQQKLKRIVNIKSNIFEFYFKNIKL